jgi:hypothetical protein
MPLGMLKNGNFGMQSIKVSDLAHKGLQLLKAIEDQPQSTFASLVILEAIASEHPDVYKALRKWALENASEEWDGVNRRKSDLKQVK